MRSYNLLKCHSLGAARAPVWGFIFFFIALFAFLSVASNLSAEMIDITFEEVSPGVLEATEVYTLKQIDEAGGILIGDKLFDSFSVETTKSVGATAPEIGGISLKAMMVDGVYGFQLTGGWLAYPGQIADSVITFHASILPEYVELGYAFKDVSLKLLTYGNDTESGVAVAENVYAGHPSISDSIADLHAYYTSNENKQITDGAVFTPVTELWVVKDVVANGGLGSTGCAHISGFYQFFSQEVPEPSSLALLGFGAFGLAAYAWRKRR